MALINCPECGSQISDQSANCIKCGYPLAANKEPEIEKPKCPECGTEITEGAAECGKCGYPLTEKKEAASSSHEPASQPEAENPDQKYFEQITSDIAYGISRKKTIKKLMSMGLNESQAVTLIMRTKESLPGKNLLTRKYRNQFIGGIVILFINFLIIAAATSDGANPPGVIFLGVVLGFLFSIRGLYGWKRYRIPKYESNIIN